MKKRNGFTVIELVIVVALAGIVAAVVIPLLVSRRVAANEAATIADIRTVLSAQEAYSSANGGFYDSNLDCLVEPSACIPSYPTTAPTFLDSMLASGQSKDGYNRRFEPGRWPDEVPIPSTSSASSAHAYRYDATPFMPGFTGVRAFAGGADGRLCFTTDGKPVPAGPDPGTLPEGCEELP